MNVGSRIDSILISTDLRASNSDEEFKSEALKAIFKIITIYSTRLF